MKLNSSLFSLAIFSAFGLASCDMFDSGSGGRAVNNPTVEQMAQLEKQWGTEPRDVHSRRSTSPVGSEPSTAPGPYGTPRVAAPAPEPAPYPQVPSADPPVFEQAPQSATPAQIQKLKN